jgi:hypothetical protein
MVAQTAVGGRPRERDSEEELLEEGDELVDPGFLLSWPSSVVEAGLEFFSDGVEDEEALLLPVAISVAFLGRKAEKCLMRSNGPRVFVRNVSRALS